MTYLNGTGRVGKLTSHQQHILNELNLILKSNNIVDNDRIDDYYLLRFLRARDFNLSETFEMIIQFENWRKEIDIDNLVKNFKLPKESEINEIYPRYYHGIDKHSHPIYIEELGKLKIHALNELFDDKGLSYSTNNDYIFELIMNQFILTCEQLHNERLLACSNLAKDKVYQSVTILDLKNLELGQLPSCLPLLRKVSQIGQNYYPETSYKMFVINTPFLFRATWSLIKGFLNERTLNKISILGSCYSKELLTHIDSNNLPKAYGGTCTCSNGCDKSDKGPWNEKYC